MCLVDAVGTGKMFRRWSYYAPSEEDKTLSYKNIMLAVPAGKKWRSSTILTEVDEDVNSAKKTYSHLFTNPDCNPSPGALPKKPFYTLREIASNFPLPVTVNVVAGHEGNDEQSSLSSGERFTILAVTESKNIKYRDDYNVRDLSLEYPFPVTLTVSEDEETYVSADELRHCPYEYVSVNQAFEVDNCAFRVGQVLKLKRPKEERWSPMYILHRRSRTGVSCIKVPTGEKCLLPPDTRGYFRRALPPEVDGKEYLLKDTLTRFRLPFYVSFRISSRSAQHGMLSSELPLNPVQILEVYNARHMIVCHKTSDKKFSFGRLLVDTPVDVAVDTESEPVDSPSAEEIELAKQKLTQCDIFFEEPYQSIAYRDLGIYRNEDPPPPIPPHVPLGSRTLIGSQTLNPSLLRPHSRAVYTTATLPITKVVSKDAAGGKVEAVYSRISKPSLRRLTPEVVALQQEAAVSADVSHSESASELHAEENLDAPSLAPLFDELSSPPPLSLVDLHIPSPLREEIQAVPIQAEDPPKHRVEVVDAVSLAQNEQDEPRLLQQVETPDAEVSASWRPQSPKPVSKARPRELDIPVAPTRTSKNSKVRAALGESPVLEQQLDRELTQSLASSLETIKLPQPLLTASLPALHEVHQPVHDDAIAPGPQPESVDVASEEGSMQAENLLLQKLDLLASGVPPIRKPATPVPAAMPRSRVATMSEAPVAPSRSSKSVFESRNRSTSAKLESCGSLTPLLPPREPRMVSNLVTRPAAEQTRRLPVEADPSRPSSAIGQNSYLDLTYNLNLAIASQLSNKNDEYVPFPPRRRSKAPKSKCQTVHILHDPFAPSASLKSKSDAVGTTSFSKLASVHRIGEEDRDPLLKYSVEDIDYFSTFSRAYDENKNLAYRSLEYPKQSDRPSEISATLVTPFSGSSNNNWTLIRI